MSCQKHKARLSLIHSEDICLLIDEFNPLILLNLFPSMLSFLLLL